MYDADEITNEILLSFDNWLKPFLELLGDNIYLQALIIFLVFLTAAKLLSFITAKVLLYFARINKIALGKKMAALLHTPVFYTLIFLGIGAAIRWLNIVPWAYKISVSIISSFIIILWTLFLIRLSRILLTTLAYREKNTSIVQVETLPLFLNLSFVLISVIAFYRLFGAWNIDMSAWLASAGIVGIAVGFAAKDTLANLFSGIFIMMDAPYKIGDFIVLDSTDRGQVTHIGIRSTRILTRDDVEVTIPNSILGNSKIINESGGPHKKYRIRVKVSVAYGSDIEQVTNTLIDVAGQQSSICQIPEPRVRFRELGNSGLLFELLCWIDEPVLAGRALDEMNRAIYNRFLQEGIEIPYSKQDIYIKGLPQQSSQAVDFK